ncbi:hypothetical protein RGQ29_018478 [Quercus rubra]|uniref:Uncharacterized protein n=1 Tax=Quercus rubra TaxID=3512 RepID=A0AAN7FP27_QUERU|nr:hypothetical protein RGQ29_018478 [Quercus rubra]
MLLLQQVCREPLLWVPILARLSSTGASLQKEDSTGDLKNNQGLKVMIYLHLSKWVAVY